MIKRPINTVLEASRRISEYEQIDSFVLSKLPPESEYITFAEAKRAKNIWLDKYAPFIPQKNRIFTTDDTILESGNYSGKYDFFKNILENNKDYDNILFIDDDIRHILKCSELKKDFNNFTIIHALELVD